MRALESLTPSGSEFVGEVERCVDYIKHRQTMQHRMIIRSVLARRKAEAEVERLKLALASIGNALGTPVPGYYEPEQQLEITQDKVQSAADLVLEALTFKQPEDSNVIDSSNSQGPAPVSGRP